MNASLFRPEAMENQADTRFGTALLAQMPLTRFLVVAATLAGAALVTFAALGHYTRKEHVGGYLAPSAGLIKVFTPQTGNVTRLAVVEGQAVRGGDVLMTISSERSSATSHESQAAIQRAVQQRRDSLRLERIKQLEIDELGAAAIVQRVRGLESQAAQAEAQIGLQRSRVVGAERNLRRNEALVEARFVSEAALQQKQDELIDQQAQLTVLLRGVAALAGDLLAARGELAAGGLKRANTIRAIDRQISELEQQITEADTRRGVVLTAPADGTVTTILADVGQTVSPGVPLLSILPAGAVLEAQLLVPTRAAGFIKAGQSVALRYQAFPYQRFGHAIGEVAAIGRTVIQPNESGLPTVISEPVYRVTVRLPSQDVRAYGQAMALQAGMALDADVWIDRRRIVEWLLDPLFSVTGKV